MATVGAFDRPENVETTVARNAYRGGVRPMLRAIAASLKEQRRVVEALELHRVRLRPMLGAPVVAGRSVCRLSKTA